MILDQIGFAVADFARSRAFYAQALAPLGIEILMEEEDWAMMGRPGMPQFWFGDGEVPGPIHVAFSAMDRGQVDAFHRATLDAGGTDNGAPGLREIYHPDYYGAVVIDPDGHSIEAVCHAPKG